ncbi:MAG: hypothetical protein KAS96_09005 [Planctomycetes bacterium]|nr:hypothetical protein [Planctomycetota bacterium]
MTIVDGIGFQGGKTIKWARFAADLLESFTHLRKMAVENLMGQAFGSSFWQVFGCFWVNPAKTIFKNLSFFTFFSVFSLFFAFFPKNDHDLTLFDQK